MAGDDGSEAESPGVEKAGLIQAPGSAPPPPVTRSSGPSVNLAVIQNPDVFATLKPDLQRMVIEGVDRDLGRDFELSKMKMENEEKEKSRALDERRDVRRLSVAVGGGLVLVGSGIYLYLVATSKDALAAAFFADSMKVLAGMIGGGGLVALYKSPRRE
jgi:hypothetical protein